MEAQAFGVTTVDKDFLIPQRIERLPMCRVQRMISIIIVIAVFFDAVDMGAMTYLLPSLKEAFKLDAALAGLLGSMSMAGMLVGSFAAGRLADRVGRKNLLQYSMILWGVSGIALALSWNTPSMFVFRFLLGLGLGAEYPVANAMLSEFLPVKSRGRYLTIMEGLAPVGVITAGLIAWILIPLVGWRWVFVVQAVPAFWIFIIRRKMPESPRWLESVGRGEEADAICTQLEDQVRQASGQKLPPIPEVTYEPARKGKAKFSELWKGDYLKRTAGMSIVWPLALLGYWGIQVWITALLAAKGYTIHKSMTYVLLIQLGGIPGFLSTVYLIDRIGRKASLLLGLLGSAVMAYLYGNAPNLALLIVWGVLLQFFFWVLWPSLYAFTPEIYPTRLRATGAGFVMSMGRLGAIAGPYLTGLILGAGAAQSWVFAMGVAAFVLGAIAVVALVPETKGKVLEEVSA